MIKLQLLKLALLDTCIDSYLLAKRKTEVISIFENSRSLSFVFYIFVVILQKPKHWTII